MEGEEEEEEERECICQTQRTEAKQRFQQKVQSVCLLNQSPTRKMRNVALIENDHIFAIFYII